MNQQIHLFVRTAAEKLTYEVFLGSSSKDKKAVRGIAERLRADGVRVWLDDWEIRPGDGTQARIEAGLENSRVLVLCMSANAFGSDWATLESYTFRFRDPLNTERRFIPLRLDDAPIKASLAQFVYIDWRQENREEEYAKLLTACRLPVKLKAVEKTGEHGKRPEKWVDLDRADIYTYAFSPDGKRALTGTMDGVLRLWETKKGRCLRAFQGHTGTVNSIAWSADQRLVLSCSDDKTVRLWDMEKGSCLHVLTGHAAAVRSVAWSTDQSRALSGGGFDKTVRLWDLNTGHCLRLFEGETQEVCSVALSADQTLAVGGGGENTVRVWEVETGRCLRVLEGHRHPVKAVAVSPEGRYALSGSYDETARLWDLNSGRCLRVLQDHAGVIWTLAWSDDCRHVLSGDCGFARLWDVETGRCLCVMGDHTGSVVGLRWNADQSGAFSGDHQGGVRVWDLSEFVGKVPAPQTSLAALTPEPEQVLYTNAKVLLVGESGVGKTGLSKRLALGDWEPSDSTVGAWATQWKLPVSLVEGVEREIWLWDFGGQADQRIIHQLYMEDTALAVLVFDGQKEDTFETLGQWDRDLARASRKQFAKLLVAGRVDAGGLRVSRTEVEKFAQERKFIGFLETSAKKNAGCEELRQAIVENINWDQLPCRTTEVLFKRLKEEIIRFKNAGRVLIRFKELREALQIRLSGERFTDEELRAVLTLLTGPGVVWELEFGSWVLVQPERINAYAQAVIRTLQSDDQQRGCLLEERVLKGDLKYESSMPRLEEEDERFVLLAMHQTLVERGLCLRQPSDKGNLLIFPSYYRRERPEQVGHPAVLVSYRFTGFLDEIYATLVVCLHHTKPFQQDRLWRYAADFRTFLGRQLGVKLTRRAQGVGILEVYFDLAVSMEEKILFSKYVHEHLLMHALEVERVRHYVCPHCGTPVANREVAMKRLDDWLQNRPTEPNTPPWFKFRKSKEEPSIICSECEKRVPLWDSMEQCFSSADIQQRVRELQEESAIVLDNESKERALVGEVISTVALAGQITREFAVSDHGIDMEIEFKDDHHVATGQRLYLQLKSGDSYLRIRKLDGEETFTIKDERHARYWMAQKFPVLLVIGTSNGEVRWMEVRDWLKRATNNGQTPVKQIVFQGERFDVMSVRRWRAKMLQEGFETGDRHSEMLSDWTDQAHSR